ncbi:hypothetical protein BGZ52_008052, partial [Haplosporangium bisporale]
GLLLLAKSTLAGFVITASSVCIHNDCASGQKQCELLYTAPTITSSGDIVLRKSFLPYGSHAWAGKCYTASTQSSIMEEFEPPAHWFRQSRFD